MGLNGLEPSTSRLSGVRSNHLSYGPATRVAPVAQHSKSLKPEAAQGLLERETKTASADIFCSNRPEIPKGILRSILRKEVIQPQVPLRLPCYDFTPVADPTVVACLLAVGAAPSGKTNSHGVTGGVYKARERIHRGVLIRDY